MQNNNKEEGNGCIHKISTTITSQLEKFFYFWGYSIASKPWLFISVCFIFTCFSCLGTLNYVRETRPERIWVPYNSRFYNTSTWLMSNFPPPMRQEFVIVTANNVLEPEGIQQMLKIHQAVLDASYDGVRWSDACIKFPVVTMYENLEDGFSQGLRKQKWLRKSKREITSKDSEHENFFDNAFSDFEIDIVQDTKKSTTSRNLEHYDLTTHASTSENNFDMKFSGQFESEFEIDTFKNSISNKTDFSVVLPREMYCSIAESIPRECWEYSILEIWNYDPVRISKLTKEEIINDINTISRSPVFGTPSYYFPLLGDMILNSTGHVVGAHSLMTIWNVEVNHTALKSTKRFFDLGLGDPADNLTLQFEAGLVDTILELEPDKGMDILVRAWRSLADASASSVENEFILIVVGYTLVFIYILLINGEFDMVEMRVVSTLMGIMCIAMSFGVAVGWCSALGILFGPLHPNLTLLLLGLGVDDIFVIVQCWHTLSSHYKGKTLPERMGQALKHGGVSITVSSLTNFAAFAVGATTVLPNMRSFCLYAALGIFWVYVFQATYFVAFFVLDQKRIEENRNCIFWWYKHSNRSEPKPLNEQKSARMVLQRLFDSLSNIIFYISAKIIIFIVCVVCLGFGIYGVLNLREKFSIIWILPHSSYLHKFGDVFFSNFTDYGEEGFIFLVDVNYTTEMDVIEDFVEKLRAQEDIIMYVDDWYTPFKHFVNRNYQEDVPNRPIPPDKFHDYLSRFLFSPTGALHQKSFKFSDDLSCLDSAPSIKISTFPFRMHYFDDASESVPALQKIRRIFDQVIFKESGGWAFAWAYMFNLWENEEVSLMELYQNMALASVCVFFCTLLVLANLQCCILVCLCVIMTLVDVLGYMHLWGLHINIVTSVVMVLSIGMSVDFAAHVGHSFLTFTGSKDCRAQSALRDIGPAVFNGGFSTLLAFVFLANADSYIFLTFFKVFTLVVAFGLLHGLLFLPVLLSLVGPLPYASGKESVNTHREMQLKDVKTSNKANRSNGNVTEHIYISTNYDNDDLIVNGDIMLNVKLMT